MQQWTISQSDCGLQNKWIVHDHQQCPAQWLDWEEASNHFPKPNLHQKKKSWSLFGGLLPVWSIIAFRILVKPLHLRSMLSKSMTCTENCNACSWHWSTERALFSTTMPNCMSHNQFFKNWMNHAWSFASSSIFTDFLPTGYYFFKHLNNFWQGKHFCNQQDAENAFQEFVKSRSRDFYVTGID